MKRTFIAAMMLLCGIGASSAQTLGVYQPNSSKMWDFSTLKDQSLPLNNGKLMVGDAQYAVSDVDSVVVRVLEAPQLTAAQQQLVKGYQEKTRHRSHQGAWCEETSCSFILSRL